MNRRHFLAGSLALAGQHKLLHSMGLLSMGGPGTGALVAPHNLLSSTYTEAFLASKLAAPGAWHPYPNWSERGPWMAIPADIRKAVVECAEADQKVGWKALLATSFLEYRRNGNRTRYQEVNFGRRSQLQHLILGECVEGQGRFLDDIANGVWLICEETFWGAPAHMAALAYFDGYRSGWLPANLIQAQRDYFGAHTYERIDRKGTFHTAWEVGVDSEMERAHHAGGTV